MAQAKNKQHFKDSWKAQVETLIGLQFNLDPEHYDELKAHMRGLEKLVDIAADNAYEGEEA